MFLNCYTEFNVLGIYFQEIFARKSALLSYIQQNFPNRLTGWDNWTSYNMFNIKKKTLNWVSFSGFPNKTVSHLDTICRMNTSKTLSTIQLKWEQEKIVLCHPHYVFPIEQLWEEKVHSSFQECYQNLYSGFNLQNPFKSINRMFNHFFFKIGKGKEENWFRRS